MTAEKPDEKKKEYVIRTKDGHTLKFTDAYISRDIDFAGEKKDSNEPKMVKLVGTAHSISVDPKLQAEWDYEKGRITEREFKEVFRYCCERLRDEAEIKNRVWRNPSVGKYWTNFGLKSKEDFELWFCPWCGERIRRIED